MRCTCTHIRTHTCIHLKRLLEPGHTIHMYGCVCIHVHAFMGTSWAWIYYAYVHMCISTHTCTYIHAFSGDRGSRTNKNMYTNRHKTYIHTYAYIHFHAPLDYTHVCIYIDTHAYMHFQAPVEPGRTIQDLDISVFDWNRTSKSEKVFMHLWICICICVYVMCMYI